MSQYKVLLADNSDQFRELWHYNLAQKGYEVHLADSPEMATELINRQLFHLVIVDLRLLANDTKEDTSGLDICKKLDNLIPRILITAYADDEEKVLRGEFEPNPDKRPIVDGFYSKAEDQTSKLFDLVASLLRREYEMPFDRRIAVLTSGGEAPGMNSAISAVVRSAMRRQVEVLGIENGYEGLLGGVMRKMRWKDAATIHDQEGTCLRSGRPEAFRDPQKRKDLAVKVLRAKHISGLVIIGGDGSMNGALALTADVAASGGTLQAVGIPGTIDNDIFGTDMSLGAATAVNVIIGSIRNMLGSAEAMDYIFVVEVMGAYAGYLALETGVATGADAVIIPENLIRLSSSDDGEPWIDRIDLEQTRAQLDLRLVEIGRTLEKAFESGKRYAFVVLAEGLAKATSKGIIDYNRTAATPGEHFPFLDTDYVVNALEQTVADWTLPSKPKVRKQVLGHQVRGGKPCRFDLWLGTVLGDAAVSYLLETNKNNEMVGWIEGKGVIETPFSEVVDGSNQSPEKRFELLPRWSALLQLHASLSEAPSR